MQFSWFNLAVILFLGAGVLFGLAPLIGATLLSPRSKGGDIGLPYECGITPHGPARVRFGINYYFYALLFLAFDVDVLYLFPVALAYGKYAARDFIEVFIFVGILSMAIVYAWRKGVFEWHAKQ